MNTHDVLQKAMALGGAYQLFASGAELLIQEGLTAAVARMAILATVQVAANRVSQHAIELAQRYGVDPDKVRIAANAVQLLTLLAQLFKSNCFVAGTEVLTGSASQPGVFAEKKIEDVRAGDLVWSKSQDDPAAPLELKRVTRTFAHRADDLQSVSVTDETGHVETLKVTDLHPFFVAGRGWIGAASLAVGDRLDSPDGHTLTVSANADYKPSGGVMVYNFTVEADHTYFVADGAGEDAFTWVHNTSPKPGNMPQRPVGVRIKSFATEPAKWKLTDSLSEPATGMRNPGGSSLQEMFTNVETGEELVRHTLFRANGSIYEKPHFRGEWKD